MSQKFSTFVLKALVDVITGGVGAGPDMTTPWEAIAQVLRLNSSFLIVE